MESDDDDKQIYRVVLNHEEQYSIWPIDREIPLGWRPEGKSGPKKECLDHINVVWTDMRPLSLRKAMEDLKNNPPKQEPREPLPPQKSLVERLSEGKHPVEVSLRPERTMQRLRERIDLGYIHVKFTQTKGGTELGFQINRDLSKLDEGVIAAENGQITLVGDLTLDYVPVRCFAEIKLPNLEGFGSLLIRNEETKK